MASKAEEFMVLDRKDLDSYLDEGRAAQEEAGLSGPVRLEIGCHLHEEDGVRAEYQAGLLRFTCFQCGKPVCLVQVAEESTLRRNMI